MKSSAKVIIGSLCLLVIVVGIELLMGRLILGPDGNFGFISLDTTSRENSQRVFDLYSLSHIAHGLIFYGILFLVARKMPLRYRFLSAVALGALWEVFENTPLIINLYRSSTISFGYVGDSIVNSVSDIFFVMIGFIFASKVPTWVSVVAVIFLDALLLLLIRDNIILNIIMLIHPVQAIKSWQEAGGITS